MPKTIFRRVSLLLAVIFMGAVLDPATTLAQSAKAKEVLQQVEERRQSGQQAVERQVQQRSSDITQRLEDVRQRNLERREKTNTRLEAAKLKVCENREKAILSIMARMSDRGAKQLNVLTKIADQVQAFYIEQGNSINNYDTLMDNLRLKKDAAQNAVSLVLREDSNFSCTGDDPKAAAARFKEDKRAMDAALNEYKIAVRDFIVEVKSAQGTSRPGGVSDGEDS